MSSTSTTATLDLALEGERLCKLGDFGSGVAFFEAAIQSGTDDLKTLSAIYSQLGNAYFFLGDYNKAVVYHRNDLTLARTMSDLLGEAKASGNLGNTLKLMGKFDEAILCCRRHLELADQLNDKVGKARALYNLANAYHAKGKHVGRLMGQQDPGEFPPEVKECLEKAMEYYSQNLELTRTLGDRSAEGRACGNLGNVHYLMGNFEEAISFHEQRLVIAQEFNDLNAQRRAYTNLGNAHVFSGEFEAAAEKYKNSLTLSQTLSDPCVEAQACYSLGNTYTLLRNYPLAIEYHLRHLSIAQSLNDKVGIGRAYWSLGNAHSAMGEHEKALDYAKLHLKISKELGDAMGEATARMNVGDLERVLGVEDHSSHSSQAESSSRRKSMQEMRLLKMTPDEKRQQAKKRSMSVAVTGSVKDDESDEKDTTFDALFEMLEKVQADRLDDQRCSMPQTSEQKLTSKGSLKKDKEPKVSMGRANSLPNKNFSNTNKEKDSNNEDVLFDMIWGLQGNRMEEQRAALPEKHGNEEEEEDEEKFFEILVKCQGARINEQRSELKTDEEERSQSSQQGTTVPDEDFFSLIARLQDKRMDDQRADVKDKNRNNI